MAEKEMPINLSWSFKRIPARNDQIKKVKTVKIK